MINFSSQQGKITLSSLMGRRHLLRFGMGLMIPIVISPLQSCVKQNLFMIDKLKQRNPAAAGRLLARPIQPLERGKPGLFPLKLEEKRDGLIYVPSSYRANQPAPLLLMLHGAGGDAEGALKIVQKWAEALATIVLAIDSRQQTWDVIIHRYSVDIAFIDRALEQTFHRYAIDPDQIAISGFSDGASYALSVGITNGDLFKHILAFSPGFMAPAAQVGKPRCFISHGQQDAVLPIDRCSHRIVPQLEQAGYEVLYREFNGPHTVPAAIAEEALTWFVAR